MSETKIKNFQLDTNPGNTNAVLPQDIPDNTVKVEPGYVVLYDGVTPYGMSSGQTSSVFPVLGAGKVSRWDLICFDVSGAVPVLKGPSDDSNLKGTESGITQDWWNSVPSIPPGYIPLAAIHVKSTTTVEIALSDIEDIRPFFTAPVLSAANVPYAPVTSVDWLVLPYTIKEGLDELAERLNRDPVGTPNTVSGSANASGSSKIAARADHTHYHGLLGNTGSIDWQHKAVELGHAASNVTHWDSGASEDDLKDRLDELASRIYRREQFIPRYALIAIQAFRQDSGWTWKVIGSGVTGSTNVISIANMLSPGQTIRRMRIRCDTTTSSGVTNNHDETYLNELLVLRRTGAPTYNSRYYYVWRDADSGGAANDANGGDEGGYSTVSLSDAYATIGYIQGKAVAWNVDFRWNNAGSNNFDLRFDDTPDPWSGSGRKAGFMIEIELERLL